MTAADRFAAYVQLLAQPDPPDLPSRGHYLKCEGTYGREAMKPGLSVRYLQYQLVERREEDSSVVTGRIVFREASRWAVQSMGRLA